MADELDTLIEKMIAGGEPEEAIAAVIKEYGGAPGFRATVPPDHYTGPDTYDEGWAESIADTGRKAGTGVLRSLTAPVLHPIQTAQGVADLVGTITGGPLSPSAGRITTGAAETGRALAHGDPEVGGELLGQIMLGRYGPRIVSGARELPAARLGNTAWEAVKGGAGRTPLVGPILKGAWQAGRRAWRASAPAATSAAADAPAAVETATAEPLESVTHKLPTPRVRVQPEGAGPQPPAKPKLRAQETARYLRDQFGSEEAGRMLYGKGRDLDLIPAAERQAAIKRLAPGPSQLPKQAERAITSGIQQGSPEEAWQYLQDAPNALAKDLLIKLMRSHQP